MPTKEDRRLRIGVLGAGQIAQAAHFGSCVKACNADLAAICDVADDLRRRMAITYCVEKTFGGYDGMLANPNIDAVIIATADAFHVAAAIRALRSCCSNAGSLSPTKPFASGLGNLDRTTLAG